MTVLGSFGSSALAEQSVDRTSYRIRGAKKSGAATLPPPGHVSATGSSYSQPGSLRFNCEKSGKCAPDPDLAPYNPQWLSWNLPIWGSRHP